MDRSLAPDREFIFEPCPDALKPTTTYDETMAIRRHFVNNTGSL